MKNKNEEKWYGYNLGEFAIGVTPVSKSDSEEAIALLMTVGDMAFPLAFYPSESEASRGLETLDAAMDALREACEHPSCCGHDHEEGASCEKKQKKATASRGTTKSTTKTKAKTTASRRVH